MFDMHEMVQCSLSVSKQNPVSDINVGNANLAPETCIASHPSVYSYHVRIKRKKSQKFKIGKCVASLTIS